MIRISGLIGVVFFAPRLYPAVGQRHSPRFSRSALPELGTHTSVLALSVVSEVSKQQRGQDLPYLKSLLLQLCQQAFHGTILIKGRPTLRTA